MQEMIIDPVVPGPQHQEMFLDLNDLLNQVNEEEEDEQFDQEALNLIQEGLANALNDPPVVDVDIPVLNAPAENFLPLEIQEEDLMAEDEIQQQLEEEEAQDVAARPQNLQVGYVMIHDHPNDVFSTFFGKNSAPSFYDGPPGPWAKFFAPSTSSNTIPQFLIPRDWVNYFTALLMSLAHFGRAKEFMWSDV